MAVTTTWTAVNTKLDLFLDDAEREGSDRLFPIALRVEAWNWAQRALCHHTPRQRSVTLVIDTDTRKAILPSDFYAMRGLYDKEREKWWRGIWLEEGDVQYTDDDLPEYRIWGGEMCLEDEISHGDTDYTLYYWAYWPDVEYDATDEQYEQEQIYVPRWAELPLVHLTTATCLMPMELFSADLNQYKIRVEAGNPLQNPRAQSADFHLAWWNRLLDLFPPARNVLRIPR